MSKRNSVRMNGSATAAVAEEVPSYLLTGKVAIVTGSGKKQYPTARIALAHQAHVRILMLTLLDYRTRHGPRDSS